MRYTPGPWKVGLSKFGRWECIFAPTTNAGEVARTESKANARLIAAAPELVAILERYLNTADNPLAMGEIAEIDCEARDLLARIRGDE